MAQKRNIIVIGGSAGAIEAVDRLLRSLPENLPVAIFVVIHLSPQTPSYLPNIFQRATKFNVVQKIRDGEPIKKGRIYIAPPDRHLMLESHRVRLVRGPMENRHRPAIDVLFRSAAVAYGHSVIGIVLTGTLDDGTAGLMAVKVRGGSTVVQDPRDAEFAEMPNNAIDHAKPDHVVRLSEMGALIARLVRTPPKKTARGRMRARLPIETEIAEMKRSENQMQHMGVPSVFACPECHGVLWEIKEGGVQRFRCRVGHAFSLESLRAEMSHTLEEALWSAVRSLEEKTALLERLANAAREHGHKLTAHRFESRAGELVPAANAIRAILLKPDK